MTTPSPPLIISHANCIDGFTAAWVARRTYPDSEFHFASYGSPPPDVRGRKVYMFDFTYPRETMQKLIDDANSFYCADHHKSAKLDLAGLPNCHFHMGMSGARLAWECFHSTTEEVPWLVAYVEDRDLWRNALPHTLEINAWIGVVEMTFKNWDLMSKGEFSTLAQRGESILLKVEQYVREMKEEAYPVRLPYPNSPVVPCVNAPRVNCSEVIGELATGRTHDDFPGLYASGLLTPPYAIGWFQRPDGKYQYSLRSRGGTGADVSEVAKLFGGGGHKAAAGFTVEKRVDERV